MTGMTRRQCRIAAALAICLAGTLASLAKDIFPAKWPLLQVTPCPCLGLPTSIGSTDLAVKMCDGNFFKMELAEAVLTKARKAVVLRYSITFGKGGGKLIAESTYTPNDIRSVIHAETVPLGDDGSCREGFGVPFAFRLGDSHVDLILDVDSRSAATIVRAEEGYTLLISVPVSKLKSHMSSGTSSVERKPVMWTPAAMLYVECVNRTKTGSKDGGAIEGSAGYGFYVHLPLCDENLWDLRKEMNVSEPKATPQVSPAPQTPEKTP